MRIHIASIALLLATCLSGQEAVPQGGRVPAVGYALMEAGGSFQRYVFDRHAVGERDILIATLYAGICHSDIHHAHGDWRPETYPMVPGHEIVGQVVQVGSAVTKFKVGDYAGVGCMVNACGACEHCQAGEEQYCAQRVLTYAAPDRFHGGERTQGGYSSNLVVAERFAIAVPAGADMAKVAPLLCAGITTYSPIVATKVTTGDRVGIAGFGGLGHMAVQYAVARGARVTVFDISEDKRADALAMGAERYVNVRNPDELQGLDERFRVILSTIPARYDPTMYMRMLRLDGELVILGLPPVDGMPGVTIADFVFQARRKVWGSQIGGIRETQQMLDYSIANKLYPRVETIPVEGIDEAYRKVIAGEVRYRYVIDISTLK